MGQEEHFDHARSGHVGLLCYDPENDRLRILEVESDDNPNLLVGLSKGGTQAHVGIPNTDDRSVNYGSLMVISVLHGFDGTTLDRLRCDDNKLSITPYGYISAAWQRQPLIWGFSDVVSERVSDLNASAGNNTLSTTPVPSGEVHFITSIAAVNLTSAITRTTVQTYIANTSILVNRTLSPAAHQLTSNIQPAILEPTDYIFASFVGCNAGDDIYLDVAGYKLDIDL